MDNEKTIKILSAVVQKSDAIIIGDEAITSGEIDDALNAAIEALQERKTGKWKKILLATVPFTLYGYDCPFCEFRTAIDSFNFCPNCGAKICGAKMKEDE